MATICIITARGGSKRIPGKNTRDFRGKPIISYSIEAALQSDLFDEVMVSTDSSEIATLAEQSGATIPFMRSEKNANDFATTAAVLLEVIDEYEKLGKKFELGCCIYPTAPFVNADILKKAHDLLLKNNFDSVFPVCKFNPPVWRALKLTDEGKVNMMWPEYLESRSQDMQSAYHDAGQFYWFRINSFKQQQQLYTANSGAIVLDEMSAQDIDNETDWRLAELKYSLLLEQKDR